MKYSAKFYPEHRKNKSGEIISENVPIMLSVVFERQRLIYYTGKRCNINQWDVKNNQLKKNQIPINGQNSRDFTSDLERLRLVVSDLFNGYDFLKIKPTPEKLREDIKLKLGKTVSIPKKSDLPDFFGCYESYIKDSNCAYTTTLQRRCTMNKIKKFNPNTSFAILDIRYLTDLNNYFVNLGLSKNSINTAMCNFKSFLMQALKLGFLSVNPFLNYEIEPQVYGNPVYLTIEERDLLYTAEVEKNMISTRDIFVLQCMLGCRISDLLNLKKSNIINGNIEYIAIKTQNEKSFVARIPLTAKSLDIISRYNFPDERLVPHKDLSYFNKDLKLLFRQVGITRMVTIPDRKTRVNKQVPICDIASSHMARRVFIGGLFKKKVNNSIIGSMSGHVKGSKAFERYYVVDNDDQKDAISLIE